MNTNKSLHINNMSDHTNDIDHTNTGNGKNTVNGGDVDDSSSPSKRFSYAFSHYPHQA
jgi:hypothetical protein